MINLRYVSQETWARLKQKHPLVYADLVESSLHGELKSLRATKVLNPWETQRLADLERWDKGNENIRKIGSKAS